MKKVINFLIIAMTIVFTGCPGEVVTKIDDIDSVSITLSNAAIYADGYDYCKINVTAYDKDGNILNLKDYKNLEYQIITGSKGKIDGTTGNFTATEAGIYIVRVYIGGEYSGTKSITVGSRILKVINSSSTEIHLITWEPIYNTKEKTYWFTPDTSYNKYYDDKGNHNVPTMKKNSLYQQEVISGSSYLYFVLTGNTDFGYYRTTEKVEIGTTGKTFEFKDGTPSKQTDVEQNDLTSSVPVLQEVKLSSKGVRSVVKEIEIINISKEEMEKK